MSCYLFSSYESLMAGSAKNLDIVVFVVWIAVCLAPLFQELNIFGLQFKQQIEDLKKDFGYQLSILKTEIRSSIEISSANQNNISVHTSNEPPKDSELPKIEEEINRILLEKGIIKGADHWLPFDNDPAVEMFKIRFAFELLVSKNTYENRVTTVLESNYSRRRVVSLGKTLNDLRGNSNISVDVLGGVSEIISICNHAIHGVKLSENQLEFVRSSASSLYKALESEFRFNYL